jgi:hypothetical protein
MRGSAYAASTTSCRILSKTSLVVCTRRSSCSRVCKRLSPLSLMELPGFSRYLSKKK